MWCDCNAFGRCLMSLSVSGREALVLYEAIQVSVFCKECGYNASMIDGQTIQSATVYL